MKYTQRLADYAAQKSAEARALSSQVCRERYSYILNQMECLSRQMESLTLEKERLEKGFQEEEKDSARKIYDDRIREQRQRRQAEEDRLELWERSLRQRAAYLESYAGFMERPQMPTDSVEMLLARVQYGMDKEIHRQENEA